MPVKNIKGFPVEFSHNFPGFVTLEIPNVLQVQTNWCWAACLNMVLRHNGNKNVENCNLADRHLCPSGTCSCCANPGSVKCNQPCLISEIQIFLDTENIKSNFIDHQIDISDIRSEIDDQKPVQVGFQLDNNGCHVILVTGYGFGKSEKYVYINNPLKGEGPMLFDHLQMTTEGDKWKFTWTGIHPKP